jgi:hydrogenase-4 component E
MDPIIDTVIRGLAGFVILTAFLILISNSTSRYAIFFSMESLALGALVGAVAFATNLTLLYVMATLIIVAKVIIVPWILKYTATRLHLAEEKEPFTNMAFQVIVAGLLTILAFVLVQPILSEVSAITLELLPLSFAIILIGFFTLATKRKANSQVMGLLVMENGISLAGISTTYGMPILVEVVVLFDILAAIVIMAIFVYRIYQHFSSIDTTKMNTLRDD